MFVRRFLLRACALITVGTAFGAHIRDETARWAKVIKARNITME